MDAMTAERLQQAALEALDEGGTAVRRRCPRLSPPPAGVHQPAAPALGSASRRTTGARRRPPRGRRRPPAPWTESRCPGDEIDAELDRQQPEERGELDHG